VAPNSITDPALLQGWGVTPWNWEFVTGVQHELLPRVSVDFGYFRRIYGNFRVTDNPETVAADYTPIIVTAPTGGGPPNGALLPNGGQGLTVYDINPVLLNGKAFNTTTNYVTLSDNFGKQIEHFNGFDGSASWRARDGLNIQGGVSIGRVSTDNCAVVAVLPEVLNNQVATGATPQQYCAVTSDWEPNYKLNGVYQLPWQNVRVSGSFLSVPGPYLQGSNNYAAATFAALRRPGLGGTTVVGLAAGGSKTVNLLTPNTLPNDRRNQLDLRFSKILKFGARTLDANFDVYNVFNSDAVLGQTNTYGTTWLLPTSILTGRLLKFGARFDF
jgi:hypothetical protein